ncbi:hypothetical protein A4A49_18734 [Nicotiana attenuata]|uniref:Uncharacterized protein n=1 Tax=Nicotiana attenuata TaxID=49451 RepID=A0A1J6J5K2_NICAT|nr:hypothetical protein A4A49_18734 [Nicotiana attenuata]
MKSLYQIKLVDSSQARLVEKMEILRVDSMSEKPRYQTKEKTVVVSTEAIGTAVNSTKVLSSGKVVGKPVTNHAKQEWIQARKNKYQRDNRGHIIYNTQGKEAEKGKGKAKLEEVGTKNKFNALEVEEVHQPTLQITEGKGEDHSNGGEKQSKKGHEKEKEGNTGVTSPNPKASGVRVGKDANTKPAGEGNQQELKRVKKEAVEKVLEEQHNGNLAKANPIVPSDQSSYEKANKKSIIDWVHRRFGTSKEELRQLNETTNQSCQDIPSQTFADSGQLENLDEIKSTKAIVLRASGEIEEVPMEYGTDQIMQLHLNVPLKTPLQHLHDLVTHNGEPIDEDLMRQNPMEDEGDDESTAENFKQVARDGDLSPTASAKGGKKTKKNQNKESQQPSTIMPRRAASLSK